MKIQMMKLLKDLDQRKWFSGRNSYHIPLDDQISKKRRRIQHSASTARNVPTSKMTVQNKPRKKNFKSKVKKSVMTTWDDLDVDYNDEEESYVGLMASTYSNPDSDYDVKDEIFSTLTHFELISTI